jgi:hypothetical protein
MQKRVEMQNMETMKEINSGWKRENTCTKQSKKRGQFEI